MTTNPTTAYEQEQPDIAPCAQCGSADVYTTGHRAGCPAIQPVGATHVPCNSYLPTPGQRCATCGWHRVDHSYAAGGIGHPA